VCLSDGFETHLANLKEMNMQEELTMKIGDIVKDRDVNLEVLCQQSDTRLQHLYRFMVENPQLKLCRVDDLMLSFRFITCGHEYPMVWMTLADEVAGLIEDGKLVVSCVHCPKETMSEEELISKMRDKVKNKDVHLTEEDMKRASALSFRLIQPLTELSLDPRTKRQAVSLARRIEVRLCAYKDACAKGNTAQAKNAGLALKRGVNFMRSQLGVPCGVKVSN
jgi:hypothetical protein